MTTIFAVGNCQNRFLSVVADATFGGASGPAIPFSRWGAVAAFVNNYDMAGIPWGQTRTLLANADGSFSRIFRRRTRRIGTIGRFSRWRGRVFSGRR